MLVVVTDVVAFAVVGVAVWVVLCDEAAELATNVVEVGDKGDIVDEEALRPD